MSKILSKAPRFFVCIAAIAVVPLFHVSAQTLDEDALLHRVDLAMYPENYGCRMTMKTVKPSGATTSITFDVYYRHGAGSRMEITAPARSKGIRFLQKENSLWLFNPRSGSRKAIRLSARDSFQGSVFSNSDVSDTEFSGKYNSTRVGKESLEVDGKTKDCVVIESVAKDRSSPYAKIRMWVDSADDTPYRMDYYAHSGLLFKRMMLSDIRNIAGRERPTLYHMDSFDQVGMYSEVVIEDLAARDDLPDRLFTQMDLTQ